MAQRVLHEGVLLLGGGRALLMQIAHPLVASGVAEHSNFRTDRIDRLLRTLRLTLAIVFGSREQALAAAGSINRVHEGVAGAGYAARDPELLLWVLATLIDTSLAMHDASCVPAQRAGGGRTTTTYAASGRCSVSPRTLCRLAPRRSAPTSQACARR